ncbi:MAG: hypothetical protein IH612_20610 [Desulfofustis sp.]|nr:hypothetical protein [Desulfofustis sp.]
MFAMTELIVAWWLLPVILYIALPLGMLGGWTIARLAGKLTGTVAPAGARTERADMVVGACQVEAV